jgi:hypothetical protein
MTHDNDAPPATPPEGFQEYADARFGFRVWMPRRFEILPDTMDPLARMIRGLNDMPEEEQKKLQPGLPIGFWDPEVLGEHEDGSKQPLRLFEYDALGGRDEPLTDAETEQMWDEIKKFMPETLASAQMPGYKFLGTRETTLGALPGLAFEYRWDGARPGYYGGDHARLVWAPTPTAMFHVYHHCSGELWGAHRSELDAVLASFKVLEPGEGREAVARAAAQAAFDATQAAGGDVETGRAAARAAYAAALEGAAAAKAAHDAAREEAGPAEE